MDTSKHTAMTKPGSRAREIAWAAFPVIKSPAPNESHRIECEMAIRQFAREAAEKIRAGKLRYTDNLLDGATDTVKEAIAKLIEEMAGIA